MKKLLAIFCFYLLSTQVYAQTSTKEQKWKIFWTTFMQAVNTKDKRKIIQLTSPDFFDGGGGSTISEWLTSNVFNSSANYNGFKKELSKGTKLLKFGATSSRATGNNMGNLYFEYHKGKWMFGGVVGD